MKQGEEDRLRRELEALRPELTRYARECLRAENKTARLPAKTIKRYVDKAIEDYVANANDGAPASLSERVKARICELVLDDNAKTKRLIMETTDSEWEKAILVAFGVAKRKLGRASTEELHDLVYQTIGQLVDFSRRFPHGLEKPLSLSTWLAQSVRSNVSHIARKAKTQPQTLRIVTGRVGDQSRGECSEEHLPAANDQSDGDEDADDADHRRRRPAYHHPFLSSARGLCLAA